MNGYWTIPEPDSLAGYCAIGELRPNLFTELTERLTELNVAGRFYTLPVEQQLAFSRGELLLICSRTLKIVSLVDMAKFSADFKAKTKGSKKSEIIPDPNAPPPYDPPDQSKPGE